MQYFKRNVSIRETAQLMGKSEMFVRIGLRRGVLPIGTAIKLPDSSRYTYYISPKLLEEFLGDIICTSNEKIDKI